MVSEHGVDNSHMNCPALYRARFVLVAGPPVCKVDEPVQRASSRAAAPLAGYPPRVGLPEVTDKMQGRIGERNQKIQSN